MSKLSGNEIRKLALSIIRSKPGGVRYSALVDQICEQSPDTPRNTVTGSVWNLDTLLPDQVAKPSRGLFTSVNTPNEPVVVGNTEQIAPSGLKVKESEFYGPFADWLKSGLDEVTEIVPLGGAALKSKWGTPDVVGVYKPLGRNLIKFQLEIVSAEVKNIHSDANHADGLGSGQAGSPLHAFWSGAGALRFEPECPSLFDSRSSAAVFS